MSASNKLGKGMKFLSVILGALLMGFLWRARGTHGFGSFWGVAIVGSVFTLLIFAVYGNRSKMKFELMPMGALLCGITVPAWGCVISMPGSVIRSVVPFSGEAEETFSSVGGGRGTVMMLLLGFSLLCVYSVFIGTLFSRREYKFWHYAVFCAVFLAAGAIAKATFSHSLMNLLAPEVTDGFKKGLADIGFEGGARQAYLEHMGSMSWGKKVPFGRYYFECVEHISFAFSALVLILTALIAFRDKVTACVALLIDLVCAVSITLADYFQICNYKTGFISSLNVPSYLRITSWSLWEFTTGFLMGFGIMLIIALLPNELTAGKKYRSEPFINNKALRYVINLLLITFAYVLLPVRALCMRVFRTLEDRQILSDTDLIEIVCIAVITAAVFVVLAVKLKKNILDKNLPVPFKMKPCDFAAKALLWFSLYYIVLYFFTLEASIPTFIYRIVKSPSNVVDMTGIEYFYVYLIDALLFEIIYIPSKRRLSSRR